MFENTIILKIFVILGIQCCLDGHYEYIVKTLDDDNQLGTIYCAQKYDVNDTVKIHLNSYKPQIYGQAETKNK